MSKPTLREALFNEILLARQRVYEVRKPTPLEQLDIGTGADVWVKREDKMPIYAYKWRGAYNKMASLTEEERQRGVVCASAGNHAQGVALSAAKLNCTAIIYMPRPTPMMKRTAVAKHGGDHVTIRLVGDTYDQAYQAAKQFAQAENHVFVHPYDDLVTMGGQGTIADEVVMSGTGNFDVVYLQIGGGGMAASVACWLKHFMPNIHIVGVEAEGQASMKAAIAHGEPVTLRELDIFCDGTAVQRTGDLTYPLCKELIDEFITVSNAEVSTAIRSFWNWRRRIVEPAGALGLAGLLSQKEHLDGKRALVVTCGANMDFSQLAVIAAEAGIDGEARHHLRFSISEKEGALLMLMGDVLHDCNIVEFQYGKSHESEAYPVIGFDGSAEKLEMVKQRCEENGIGVEDVSQSEDIHFRVIQYSVELFKHPLMLHYEFPERVGALHEFLESIKEWANICYFNYLYTGERVGRALVGLEFQSLEQRAIMLNRLKEDELLSQRHKIIPPEVATRILNC
ncbi:MAG: pyridoxal-phosphate dependent enzyme [Fibrobacterales bacterium]